MFQVPDLSESPFYAFRVEFDFEFEKYEPPIASKLRKELASTSFRKVATNSANLAAPEELSVEFNASERSAGLILSVQRDLAWQLAIEVEGTEEFHRITPQEFEAYLSEKLDALRGLADVEVQATCQFEVSVKRLSEDGFVRRSLGVRTKGQESLRLTGAQFAIGGDDLEWEMYRSVSWFVEPWCSWDDLIGSIDFRGKRDLSPNLLLSIIEWGKAGFERYILESHNSAQ